MVGFEVAVLGKGVFSADGSDHMVGLEVACGGKGVGSADGSDHMVGFEVACGSGLELSDWDSGGAWDEEGNSSELHFGSLV